MPPSPRSYAVVWRGDDGVSHPGRLTLGPSALRFEGGRGRLSAGSVAYLDVAAVRTGALGERIGGRPTLVLERRAEGRPLYVTSVGGPGSVAELLDRLGPLVAAARAA